MDINDLIKEIQRNPDKLYDKEIEDKLPEILNALSPYTFSETAVSSSDKKKIVMLTYTNLQENYMKRYLMTSFVGYIYRMWKEYEVPAEHRTWLDAPVAEPTAKEVRAPYLVTKLKAFHTQLTNAINIIDMAEKEFSRLEMKKLREELDDRTFPEEDEFSRQAFRATIDRALFGVTSMFIRYGREAELKLDETVEPCRRFEDMKHDIEQVQALVHPPPEQRTLPDSVAKTIIKSFLDNQLEFNPDEHVRTSSSDVEPVVAQHDHELDLLKSRVHAEEFEDLVNIMSSREQYNALMYLMRKSSDDEEFKNKTIKYINNSKYLLDELKIIRNETQLAEHVPPQDTFFRWDYYSEVNMEEIRTVVEKRYHDRPALDLALMIYDSFEGTDDELKKYKDSFMTKYGEEVRGSVFGVDIGRWVIMSNFKENRKEIDFLNRDTEIMKKIFDRIEEDKKIGKELMLRRPENTRKKNAREGPEPEIMKTYKQEMKRYANIGAERELTTDEKREFNNLKHTIEQEMKVMDVPDDSIKVDVLTHDTDTGELKRSAFYTQSFAPGDDDDQSEK